MCENVCGFQRKAGRLPLLNRFDLTAYIGSKVTVHGKKSPGLLVTAFPFKIDFKIDFWICAQYRQDEQINSECTFELSFF